MEGWCTGQLKEIDSGNSQTEQLAWINETMSL